MDTDVSRWVLEFFLRSSVPDSLISKTLTALPLSGADSRLKKTLLLRTLQSLHSKASITETALEILELIEEIDRNDAVPIPDSMRRAYCAVAVECTVKYLVASPYDAEGNYFAAVQRIWRGRVAEMEENAGRRREGLFSGELARWRDDVEAAVLDPRVCERLAGLNSRAAALSEVKVYLKEAWEVMGPSFLESVAVMAKAKGLCLQGVREFGFGGEPARKSDGGVEGSRKEGRVFVGGDRSELENDDDGTDDNNDACCMEDENQGKEEDLEERVGASVDLDQEYPAEGEKEIQKGNVQLKGKHIALRRCHKGVKISGTKEVEPANSRSKYDLFPSPEVKEVQESLKSSSLELRALVKDPLPDALRTSEVVRSELAAKDINHEPHIENPSGDVDVPDPDVCKSIVLYRPNDASLVDNVRIRPNNANLVKKSSVHCPNLLERKNTARTSEWDDSIDNLPQGKQLRRRKRKWTSLEEETLRNGVKTFGEGNWTAIRSFYSNIFENRSGGDLKDKWRNMMR